MNESIKVLIDKGVKEKDITIVSVVSIILIFRLLARDLECIQKIPLG